MLSRLLRSMIHSKGNAMVVASVGYTCAHAIGILKWTESRGNRHQNITFRSCIVGRIELTIEVEFCAHALDATYGVGMNCSAICHL